MEPLKSGVSEKQCLRPDWLLSVSLIRYWAGPRRHLLRRHLYRRTLPDRRFRLVPVACTETLRHSIYATVFEQDAPETQTSWCHSSRCHSNWCHSNWCHSSWCHSSCCYRRGRRKEWPARLGPKRNDLSCTVMAPNVIMAPNMIVALDVIMASDVATASDPSFASFHAGRFLRACLHYQCFTST